MIGPWQRRMGAHVSQHLARRFQPLRRAVKVPVWADLGIRLSAALGLIFIVVMIHWFDRAGSSITMTAMSASSTWSSSP